MPGKKRGRCKTAEVEADFVADALASFMDDFGSNDMKKIFKDLVDEQTARSRPRGWSFIKYYSLLHALLSEAPNASIKHSVLHRGIMTLAQHRNIFRPNEASHMTRSETARQHRYGATVFPLFPNEFALHQQHAIHRWEQSQQELTEKANTYAVHIGWLLSKLRGVALQTYPIKPVKKGLKPAELQQLQQLIDMQDLDSPSPTAPDQQEDVVDPDECQAVVAYSKDSGMLETTKKGTRSYCMDWLAEEEEHLAMCLAEDLGVGSIADLIPDAMQDYPTAACRGITDEMKRDVKHQTPPPKKVAKTSKDSSAKGSKVASGRSTPANLAYSAAYKKLKWSFLKKKGPSKEERVLTDSELDLCRQAGQAAVKTMRAAAADSRE